VNVDWWSSYTLALRVRERHLDPLDVVLGEVVAGQVVDGEAVDDRPDQGRR